MIVVTHSPELDASNPLLVMFRGGSHDRTLVQSPLDVHLYRVWPEDGGPIAEVYVREASSVVAWFTKHDVGG